MREEGLEGLGVVRLETSRVLQLQVSGKGLFWFCAVLKDKTRPAFPLGMKESLTLSHDCPVQEQAGSGEKLRLRER